MVNRAANWYKETTKGEVTNLSTNLKKLVPTEALLPPRNTEMDNTIDYGQ